MKMHLAHRNFDLASDNRSNSFKIMLGIFEPSVIC